MAGDAVNSKRSKETCIDCWAEFCKASDAWVASHFDEVGLPEPKLAKRPATKPGPRCVTHDRAKKQASKLRAQQRRDAQNFNQEAGMYELVLAFQGGTCAIPKCRAKGLSRRLAWDHDHSCCPGPVSCGNCIRGLLCKRHNLLLGMEGDDPEVFQGIIDYIENSPYQRMKQG